jgi:hypothetical protein
LAHVDPNKVKAAYKRTDLFEKRRRLMEDWAVFCSGQSHGKSDNIVSINSGRIP